MRSKKMKKLYTVLCALLILTLAACSGSAQPSANIEGSLEDIMEKVYENADTEAPGVWNIEITDENREYYFGGAEFDYKEAISSDAMVNAVPHSICLIRLNSADDAKDAVEKLKANANPRKWICVEVSEDDVVADSIGDLVIFIMAENSGAYLDGFKALSK